jgi:hypothetical protein
MNETVAVLLLVASALATADPATALPATRLTNQDGDRSPIIIMQEGAASFWSSFWPAVLGGGATAGLISVWGNAWLERRRRRIELLDSQIRNLYGPLQFFVSGSQGVYRQASIIEQALHKEYGGENAQKHPPQRMSDEINAAISVNNEYFAVARENTQRIVDILTNNYPLIEPDDAEMFAQVRMHHLRHKTEFDDSGHLKLPLEVYAHVGDIYSLLPEFAELVNRRFKEKTAAFRKLIGSPQWPSVGRPFRAKP